MTEQEAIKIHIEECNHRTGVINEFLKTHKDVDSENIGKCEENIVILKTTITALEEIQQYRAIGTVEECRRAVEKQRAKKPTPYIKNHLLNYKGQCKCGAVFLDKNTEYCGNCGQRIDWSE